MSSKKLDTHIVYYAFLGIVLFLGFLAAQRVNWLLISLPISYSILAILHHAHEHTLTPKIVVEYVLVASIGMAVFAFLIIGGLI